MTRLPDLTFDLQSSIMEITSCNYADGSTRELTAVGVNAVVVQEPNPEVVQYGGFVKEAESRQVVFPLQDVGVAQVWEVRGGRHRVIHLLSVGMEVRSVRGAIFFFYRSVFRSAVTFPSESCRRRCFPLGL